MKKPLISVIIPVYNDELYIAATIESCIRQSFKDIEIVIVDDASTDETPRIIADYAKRDDRIKVIRHDKNKKTFTAIKDGVMLASGLYTVVIGGDDTFDLHAMETVADVIKDNPDIDIVHFGRRVLNNENYEVRDLVPRAIRLEGGEILKELFTQHGESRVNHHVRKRSVSVDIYNKYFKHDKELVLGEDQIMAFLYALKAHSYIGITAKLYNYYFYRGNDGNKKITLDYFLNYRMNIIDSMNELQRCLDDVGVDGWVWERFFALRKHHFAWAVFVTEKLSKQDANTALSAWVERVDATETLLGIATTTPSTLHSYIRFIINYKKPNQSVELCRRMIKSFQNESSERFAEEISVLRNKNQQLDTELRSYLSVKRSAKLTAGNLKRRILYGKKR